MSQTNQQLCNNEQKNDNHNDQHTAAVASAVPTATAEVNEERDSRSFQFRSERFESLHVFYSPTYMVTISLFGLFENLALFGGGGAASNSHQLGGDTDTVGRRVLPIEVPMTALACLAMDRIVTTPRYWNMVYCNNNNPTTRNNNRDQRNTAAAAAAAAAAHHVCCRFVWKSIHDDPAAEAIEVSSLRGAARSSRGGGGGGALNLQQPTNYCESMVLDLSLLCPQQRGGGGGMSAPSASGGGNAGTGAGASASARAATTQQLQFANGFLQGCTMLVAIKFGHTLHRVRSIPGCFLDGCTNVREIFLFQHNNADEKKDDDDDDEKDNVQGEGVCERIGGSFLADCRKLTRVDLSPFGRVETIGTYFLDTCSALRQVDLRPFRSVTSIDAAFLRDCKALEDITGGLSSFTNVTTIGDYFLSGCARLLEVDLAPLRSVTEVGDGFLLKCKSLVRLRNVGALCQMTVIPNDFLKYTTNIDISDLWCPQEGLPKLTRVRRLMGGFLESSGFNRNDDDEEALILRKQERRREERVDLTFCSQVGIEKHNTSSKKIGGSFFANCRWITTLDLTPLQHVEEISHHFLRGCHNLEHVNLRGLGNVTELGNGFLGGCAELKVLDLSPLTKVTTIGCSFLASCTRLQQVDLSVLCHIEAIPSDFLSNCSALKEVVLDERFKPTLKIIGHSFLRDCTSLSRVDLAGVHSTGCSVAPHNFLLGIRPSALQITGVPQLAGEQHDDSAVADDDQINRGSSRRNASIRDTTTLTDWCNKHNIMTNLVEFRRRSSSSTMETEEK